MAAKLTSRNSHNPSLSDSNSVEARMTIKEQAGSKTLSTPRTIWISFAAKIVKHITFTHIHLSYFSVLACFGSLFLWWMPRTKLKNLSYIDALFTAVSTLCLTGLSSVNIQDWSAWDKACILSLSILNSIFLTSLFPIYLKQFYFKHRLKFSVEGKCSELQIRRDLDSGFRDTLQGKTWNLSEDVSINTSVVHLPAEHMSYSNVFRKVLRKLKLRGDSCEDDEYNYGSFLSLREMEEEAKVSNNPKPLRILKSEALHTLAHVVLLFAFVTQLLGFAFIEIYLVCSPTYLQALRHRNVNHVFFAFSTAVGQFTNTGIVFLNDEFAAFRYCAPILLCVGLQALLGNTLYAPSIRAILCILHRVSSTRKRLAYEFLLKYPRKCYTHLFTSKQTIWLIVTVLCFIALQTAFFLALEWNSKVFEGVAATHKILGGFFQCVTTRNAGGTTFNIAELSQAMLVLYTAMMYMGVYPLYLTRESSRMCNSEELEMIKLISDNCRRGEGRGEVDAKAGELVLLLQLRKLLARDSAYLFVAIFTICIVESWNINHDPLNFSIFSIFFEVISAYGNIGLSVGYHCKLRLQMDSTHHASSSICEDSTASFSGKWSTSGKLLLMIVMILGRIRSLPDEADEASRLPWNVHQQWRNLLRHQQRHHQAGLR